MPDVEGKSSLRRYRAKLAHLLAKGWDLTAARRKAAGYAGGKTVPAPATDDGGDVGLPYAKASDLPEAVRNVLPADAQEIWMAAFNSAHEEGVSEAEAAARAWAAVKKAGFEKGDGDKWVKAAERQGYAVILADLGQRLEFKEELSLEQICRQINGLLSQHRPFWDGWVKETYSSYAIIEDYRNAKHYRAPYSVTNGQVEIGELEEVVMQVTYEPIQAGECERFYGLIVLEESELKKDDGAKPATSEIELLRTGKWNHPEYGKFSVDEEDLDEFIANFEANIRGIDLAVDQAHKPDEGAAGWFRKLYKKVQDGASSLWATVEWTPLGQALVEGKIFRYISPEFAAKYKDGESGKTAKNVLYGAALTNRPFIKGMAPVMLTERLAEELAARELALLAGHLFLRELEPGPLALKLAEKVGKPAAEIEEVLRCGWKALPKGWDQESVEKAWDALGGSVTACMTAVEGHVDDPGGFCAGLKDMVEGTTEWRGKKTQEGSTVTMKLEELKKALGLDEKAGEQAVVAALEALRARADQAAVLAEIAKTLKLGDEADHQKVLQAVAQLQQRAGQAGDRETEVKNLKEENSRLSGRLKAVEDQLRLADWEKLAGKALEEGRLTPKMKPEFEKRFMADPEGTKVLLALLEPVVEMGERGSQRDGSDMNTKIFNEKVQAKMKDAKLEYADAALAVAEEEPALWAEVNRERRGGK